MDSSSKLQKIHVVSMSLKSNYLFHWVSQINFICNFFNFIGETVYWVVSKPLSIQSDHITNSKKVCISAIMWLFFATFVLCGAPS